MPPQHILIVDDDTLLRRSLAFNLQQAGYRVSSAADAEAALALSERDRPDLVLLDIGLPGMDGLDALKAFRERDKIAVIFLSARRRELEQVLGLELGADDYVTKPFEIDLLLARIKAVLRRVQVPATALAREPIVVGEMVVDPAAHTVTVRGQPVELTRREFELLHALALEAGHVLTVNELLARVWGAEYEGEPQVVYVHVRWLRKKLEDNPREPRWIVSVRGVGYKLQAPEP